MRKYLALMIVGALSFGLVSFATAGSDVQTEEASVKPKKLPKKKHKNVTFVNTITTFDKPGTNQPPKGNRTVLDLPKQFKINLKGVPKCKTGAAGLEGTSTKDAIKACGKGSMVSDPKGSSAQVRIDTGADAIVVDVDVTAFNAKKKSLYLHSKPTGDADGLPPSILVGKLMKFGKVEGRPPEASKGKRAYRQSLDVTIPPLAAGAISFFEVTIPKKSKYIKARCKPKKMKFQATTFFDDAPSTTDKDTHKCKVKN